MSLSFQTKLVITLSLLGAGISTASSLLFYETIQSSVWSQTASRLKDVGRAGQFMLNLRDRLAIKDLDESSESLALPRPASLLQQIRPGENVANLSDDDRETLESRPEYRRLVQIMRRIKHSTRSRLSLPGEEIAQQIDPADPPLLRYAYILVPIPESPNGQILKFIVDGDDRKLDTDGDGRLEEDEEPTQIGMLYNVAGQPGMLKALKEGVVTASEEYYRDEWGVWFSAYIPILDESGNAFAVMGIDLSAESEFSLIIRVRRILFSLVITSVFLSAFLGLIIARILSRPLMELAAAVERVQHRDFDVRLKSTSTDELGRVARAFNSMVREIDSYTSHMEDIVLRRTGELQQTMDTLVEGASGGGDGFLMRFLSSPYSGFHHRSKSVSINVFRRPSSGPEQGADFAGDREVCMVQSLNLKGQSYTVLFMAAVEHSTVGSTAASTEALVFSSLMQFRILSALEEPSRDADQWFQESLKELDCLEEVPSVWIAALLNENTGLLRLHHTGVENAILYREGEAKNLTSAEETSTVERPASFRLSTGDRLFLEIGLPGGSHLTGDSEIQKFGPPLIERYAGRWGEMEEYLNSRGPDVSGTIVSLGFRTPEHGIPGEDPRGVIDEVKKLIHLGSLDGAISLLEKMEAGDFFRNYYAAMCYSRQGDHTRALEYLQTARKQVEERANALLATGQLLYRNGFHRDARDMIARAQTLWPENEGIQSWMLEMQRRKPG